MTAGLRPEGIVVGPANGSSDESTGFGIVRLTEPSGPTLWVTVELNDLNNEAFTIIGTAQAGFVPKIGDPVAVGVRHANIHLFDTTTGMRLDAA